MSRVSVCFNRGCIDNSGVRTDLIADGEAASGGDVDCYNGPYELTAIETW